METMEEVQVIDCPPTPEILLASSTPPSTSLLGMFDSSSSAEELDNCPGEIGEGSNCGRNSPPPKCAICLGKCRQKCYTDSCRHQFCYRCLLEWSKIKAECPLCKQVFRSIIYNQKTFDRYEEHIISIVPPASPTNSAGGPGSSSAGGAGRVPPQVYHRLDFTLSQPPRFTYSATLRVQPSQSERLQQLFLHQSGDVQRFSREFPDDSIPSRQSGSEWRRYIYHRRLHARPLPDINGRFRECSAAFYMENPAQIHRLMPWINRELIALCRTNPAQIPLILDDFPNLLMMHDITSPAFRERVSYWGRTRTAHFIHELLNFARSPYDMIGYDRCVQYDPYYNSVVVLSSSSSSSSASGLSGSDGEDDGVRVIEPIPSTSGTIDSLGGGPSGSRRGRTQFTIETRSSDQTVIMTGSFGGAGVSGIVSVSTSGTQTGPPGTSVASSSGVTDMSRMPPLTSMLLQPPSRLQDGENISLSSSDSDDCRIVGALKPPHLRTPEMVSLESETDSDVVFVNDQDDRREAVPTVDINPVLEQLFNESQDVLAKIENPCPGVTACEYNNGASTSSGGGGGGACLKKYYARPRLNRYSAGVGFKSIYEASESEEIKEQSMSSDSDSSSHDEVKYNIRNQPPAGGRKRKATKRRQPTPSESSSESSDESSTSDTECSRSSSSCSSLSSSSPLSSDSEAESVVKSETPSKKCSRKRKLHNPRKTSKDRRKEVKKRPNAKKRKTSVTKRTRKRQKSSVKVPKSSSESGKGTSVSCTSVPSTETIPNVSCSTSPKSSISSSNKRKLRSVVIKPNTLKVTRQPTTRKRRKVPICSELITSTDFSSEENQPEVPVPQPQPLPEPQPVHHLHPEELQDLNQTLETSPLRASTSEDDSSDSSEDRCAIASLIRQQLQQEDLSKQSSSTASTAGTSSATGSSSTSFCSMSHTEGSSPAAGMIPSAQKLQLEPNKHPTGKEHEEEEDEEDEEEEEEEEEEDDDDVSVTQAIAVGAEVEL